MFNVVFKTYIDRQYLSIPEVRVILAVLPEHGDNNPDFPEGLVSRLASIAVCILFDLDPEIHLKVVLLDVPPSGSFATQLGGSYRS